MENFPYIPFIPDKKTVLRRLGSSAAKFSAALQKDFDRYLAFAETAFHAKGKAGFFAIEHIDESHFRLAGEVIESKLLTRMLSRSRKIYLICTTIPEHEVEIIHRAIEDQQGLKALVLDAYASEYVDGVLDVIIERKNAALRRTGQKLTKRRFSAGYGDLDICYQKVFFNMLDMQTLNVQINENFLLVPEKSVIAIAGVE